MPQPPRLFGDRRFTDAPRRAKMAQRIQEYREGYYDKRREMGLKN